ncbi:MAG TPA: GNAT family N-acetyltransferase [Tepidisphaeraceae bacterium]|nr:GNAT family N-acetyltransferase [Tepidisphaeraceae bacterium]
MSVATRQHLSQVPAWERAFALQRKDRRYYEIVEDTIRQGFEYRYFVLEDKSGTVRGIQPFFILRQDLLQGSGAGVARFAAKVRRVFPRFLTLRTLMVGCAAGEGHLDQSDAEHAWIAGQLHEALKRYAKSVRAPMVVLKEFPAGYRSALNSFASNGYARVPSLPSIRLHLPYASFEDYMNKALSKATRKDLRRKFRDTENVGITMEVLTDLTRLVDELYPLYLQVYDRSELHFEKLTKEYLCRLGKEMADKARFFVWRQNGKAIAFSVCLVNGDEIHDEYVGLDYSVALDLHLYFMTLRDVLEWAMRNGYKWYYSSAMGYDPKLRLKCELVPLDLYVAHTFAPANFVMKRVLPLLEPTRNDPTLPKFPNFAEIWGPK